MKIRKPVVILIIAIVILFVLILATESYREQNKDVLSLTWKSLGKSFEQKYAVYSAVFDEAASTADRTQAAKAKIVKLGKAVIPLIIEDLTSAKNSAKKKGTLLNTTGLIDPEVYRDIVAGPPYSEIILDAGSLREGLSISLLKKATIPPEQRQHILKRLESLAKIHGGKHKISYSMFRKYCEQQGDTASQD